MVYLPSLPPFSLSKIANHHAYCQMPPPLYETTFSIGNFHGFTSPQYCYYDAPKNLCQTLSKEKMEKVQKGEVPFMKLTQSMLNAYYLEAYTSSLSLNEDKVQGCVDASVENDCLGAAYNDFLNNGSVVSCSSFSDDGASSAFGDDEDDIFTATEETISPSCSRSSTPDFFPFVSSMKPSEFPPLHEVLPASETGSSEDSTSKPLSKYARRAFNKKTKWRVISNGALSEGESGYQSEISIQYATAYGENQYRLKDSNVHRNNSALVVKDSKFSLKSVLDSSTSGTTANESLRLSEGISRMDLLSEHICAYYEKVTQTEKNLLKKLRLRDILFNAIVDRFYNCGLYVCLYVVGSSLNGFGNESSDMDLCLVITNEDLIPRTEALNVLMMVEETLSSLSIIQKQKLIKAKVPILRIKFNGPFSNIIVDLNANNVVAIKNTHLLCHYAFFDWRIRPLVAIVKEWAKRGNINDASRSSFTSYSLVLMVIYYLQVGVKVPVLPSLQQMYPRRFNAKNDFQTLDVSRPLDNVPASSNFIPNNDSSLGELLIGFFHFYAHVYNYEENAISIRLGRPTGRHEIIMNVHHWSPVCIEEPFTHLNTAHSIYDERVFEAIKIKFREAYKVLENTSDLTKLLDAHPSPVSTLHPEFNRQSSG